MTQPASCWDLTALCILGRDSADVKCSDAEAAQASFQHLLKTGWPDPQEACSKVRKSEMHKETEGQLGNKPPLPQLSSLEGEGCRNLAWKLSQVARSKQVWQIGPQFCRATSLVADFKESVTRPDRPVNGEELTLVSLHDTRVWAGCSSRENLPLKMKIV